MGMIFAKLEIIRPDDEVLLCETNPKFQYDLRV
jgi:hypothetical protein